MGDERASADYNFHFVVIGVIGADGPTLLRCIANQEFNRANGRYTLALIDLSSKSIHTKDYYTSGVNAYDFELFEVTDQVIRGKRINQAGAQAVLMLDRQAGRMTHYTDASASADKLWNEEKLNRPGISRGRLV